MTYPITPARRRPARACAAASLAHATENGQISYPVGVNTVLNGLLPPPGATQFFNYSIYYSADRFAGPHGGSAVPGSPGRGGGDAAHRAHLGAWPGPFTISSSAIVPIQRAPVHASRNRSQDRAGRRDTGAVHAGLCQSCKGLPRLLRPRSPPTGAYSSSRIANTGLNTYAFLPYLSMSWFPSPRWEVSATTLIEANTRNRATGYQSGSVAVLDYQATPSARACSWRAHCSSSSQTTGRTASRSARISRQAAGIGPQLRYMGPASGIAVKYQHEFAVRNRPQGGKLWVQFSFDLNDRRPPRAAYGRQTS